MCSDSNKKALREIPHPPQKTAPVPKPYSDTNSVITTYEFHRTLSHDYFASKYHICNIA